MWPWSYKNGVRRAVQVGVIGLGLAMIAVSLLTTVGAERYCTGTVLPKLEGRLGARVTAADVAGLPGRLVLENVAITPRGAAAPLLSLRSVEARYSIGSLLSARRLDSLVIRGVDLRADPRALPAFRDLLAHLRRPEAAEAAPRSGPPRALPAVSVREVRVAYDDPEGLHVQARIDAALGSRTGRLLVRGLRVSGRGAPVLRARAATVDLVLGAGGAIDAATLEEPALALRWQGDEPEIVALGERARAAVEILRGGPHASAEGAEPAHGAIRVEIHRGVARIEHPDTTVVLGDIHGWIAPDLARRAAAAQLSGRVGDEASWEIETEADGGTRSVLGRVRLAQLPLTTVLPLLPHLPVDVTAGTRLSTRFGFRYDHAPGRLGLDGEARAEGLTITSPMVATEPLRDLDLAVSGKGAIWLRSRELAVSDARVTLNGIPLLVHGDVARSGGLPRITADLTLPPTPCGALLRSMPTALVAHLGGMELEGVFGADLHLVVDLERPEHTDVRFDVGNECRLLAEDFARVERLRAPFVQRAVSAGQAVEFVTGPGSPGWTPYGQISPHLVAAVLTTEDGGFFSHTGFSADSIRRALVRDLREGRFVVGGSTISMQLAKNVFLGHEKTLARKLQEAVLTWMLEQSMAKEEILELYFNVIEYGPGLYGIRNATHHYFGVPPSELTPIQAVYIATILPSPVQRYGTFLRGSPTPALMERLHRILRLMASRGRLDGSLEEALAEPLTFRGGSQVADGGGPGVSDDDSVVQ